MWLRYCGLLLTVVLMGSCSEQVSSEAPGPSEQQFCATVGRYIQAYARAVDDRKNEVALSQIRIDRKAALASLMSGGREVAWRGTIIGIATDGNQTAHLTVELSCGRIPTPKGATPFGPGVLLSDEDGIKSDSPVFAKLAGLKDQQTVQVNGSFRYLGSRWSDFIQERSLTELGSMTRPEFLFTFSDIDPL